MGLIIMWYVLWWYDTAKEIALEVYGMYHYLVARIMLNSGIAYEDNRDFKKAYAHFKTNYEINMQV